MQNLNTISPEEPAVRRRIARVVTPPPPAPGFIGEGHTAVEVLAPDALEASDPFVLLMDDRLDVGTGRRLGGEHPHAGLETVTLVLEGSLRDRDEGVLASGDALWMTAGRGIIHNESVEATGRVRVLQLWIRLPQNERSAEPAFAVIRRDSIPISRHRDAEARLYSGSTGGLASPTRNHVPVTLVDIALEPGASFDQDLPRSYNGFLYILEGRAQVTDARLAAGQVGWLDRPSGTGASVLTLRAGDEGVRAILYAGEPQHEPLVQHGPFVAGSAQDITRLFREYRSGQFTRMSELARAARLG